jgi:hypothetical protein
MMSSSSDSLSEKIRVDLGDGVQVNVEVDSVDTGLEEVAVGGLPFDSISKAITKISEQVAGAVQKVQPSKVSVKYGLEIGIEQGSLMATIVRGSGTANLEITLEWENKPSSSHSSSSTPADA